MDGTQTPAASMTDAGNLKFTFNGRLTKHVIDAFNAALSAAEDEVRAEERKAKKEREDFLSGLAETLGLPVK